MVKLFLSLSGFVAAVCATTIAMPYSPQNGGKVAPSLYEEYAFNFIQHKWNENGFGVSHVASGTWLSSIKHQRLRNDLSSYDWVSNNATIKGNLRSGTVTTVFDFSQLAKTGNVTNIYIESNAMQQTCSVTDLPQMQSQGQLFPADFIQQHGIYAGQETINGIGATFITDKWMVMLGNTIVSFYFDQHENWVRFDENSEGLKTSVVTWIYNLNKHAKFDKAVFDIKSCAA